MKTFFTCVLTFPNLLNFGHHIGTYTFISIISIAQSNSPPKLLCTTLEFLIALGSQISVGETFHENELP